MVFQALTDLRIIVVLFPVLSYILLLVIYYIYFKIFHLKFKYRVYM